MTTPNVSVSDCASTQKLDCKQMPAHVTKFLTFVFVSVPVSDASMIGVRGLPSLYFIQDSRLKYKMEGADTADNLVKLADHYFFDGPKPEEPEVPTV